MLIMLCTLSASAEWKFYLMSDSIFSPTKFESTSYTKSNGTVIKMSGTQRLLVDEDGLIELTGDYKYVQITEKPFALVAINYETEEYYFLYAYDWYYDVEYNENTGNYDAVSDYYHGKWNPEGSQIWKGFTANGMIDSWKYTNYEDIYEYLWFTYDCYTEKPYYYFGSEPGLYVVRLTQDKYEFGIVMEMYRLADLKPIPTITDDYPTMSLSYVATTKKDNVNVNVWYDYYTITGGTTTQKSIAQAEQYIMNGDNVISSGEYAGCQYIKLPSEWSGYNVFICYPEYNENWKFNWQYYYIETPNDYPQFDKWYDLKAFDSGASGIFSKWKDSYPGNVGVIWDVEGKRMKFLKEADFQKILSDATAIDNPTQIPYIPYYYSLDGQVIENPTPGKIYIHNGKKVVYKK